MRRYDRFDGVMARLLGVLPPDRSATYRVFRTFGPLESEGDLGPLRAAVATVTPEEDASGAIRDLHNLILALWSHDPDSVSRISKQAAETTFVFNGVKYPKSWYKGLAARMRGDKKGAQAAFAAARLEVEKAVLADASDGRALSLLAMIDAGLGRQEQAVQEAEHACDLVTFENFGTICGDCELQFGRRLCVERAARSRNFGIGSIGKQARGNQFAGPADLR